ncbi:MAG: ABC transporter substrate-binding protein [Chloroflexota bacterium]
MKLGSARVIAVGLLFGLLLGACAAPTPTATPVPTPTPVPVAATPTPSPLLKAKQEAEARGYIFETSHDDIVAKAKAEGKMRVLSGFSDYKGMESAFKADYPFLDVYVEEITGTEAAQRFIMELKSGTAKGWDASHLSLEIYSEYQPHLSKFDILGMAQQGVLSIAVAIIDPVNRNVAAPGSSIRVVAYNKNLIAADKVPNTWEDFLKPEFKGRKFVADIRPDDMAFLVPAWGLDKTVDFARKIALQEPVWARGASKVVTSMNAGEYALSVLMGFDKIKRTQDKDPTGSLVYKIVEPVPAALRDPSGVLLTADHPYAGLLWIEFAATPNGQKVLDETEPYGGSIFVPGSALEGVIRGKELSLVEWDLYPKIGEYGKKIVEAYGFPVAEISK